jgi:TolB protein
MKHILITTLLLAGLALGQAQRKEIEVDVFGAGKKPIPIAIEGFTGETLALLKFDLFVQGFGFVDKAKAQFTIKGSHDGGGVSGEVYDHVKRGTILKRRYKGGSLRQQAHTFANNTVEAITGSPGIGLTRIAFKQKHGRNSEIHVADFDGHNSERLTHDNSIVAGPGWMPNNDTLYYCSYRRHNADIYSHNVKTGARQEVVRYAGSNISPAVSPDGRRLAMVLSKAGSPDIWVGSAANGTGLRRLTTTKDDESSPCWSPDGRWICFTSRDGGSTALYKIPANGGAMSRIHTIGAFNATEPDWSPDGKAIAFTTMRGGGVFEICIVPPGGGNVEVIATGEDPSWAPNSRTLMFTSRSGRKRFLSVLDVPTKRVKTLPRSFPGNCSQAAWTR